MDYLNKTTFARKLRKNQTDAEALLWSRLKNRQLAGLKFRRQKLIEQYIVDFACTEKKIVIELDGSQHLLELNKQKDAFRTAILESKGYKVIRFWDNEVLNNTQGVLEKILLYILTSILFSVPKRH
jgi:very-short-patch-repair endonuclease